MFNSMMDPEVMTLAQEHMSRLSPAEMAKIKQELLSDQDLKYAGEQIKDLRPEDIAELFSKCANASPEELAAMCACAEAQISYGFNAAEMLKKQGNELHRKAKYHDAAEKYLLAKKNLKQIPDGRNRPLLLACSLNLMSCYLKTRQYHDCVTEGSEVLACDGQNVKALYRRGQAHKELGQLEDAVSDLSKVCEVFPDDHHIAEVLRAAKESLSKEGTTTLTSSDVFSFHTVPPSSSSSGSVISESIPRLSEKHSTVGVDRNDIMSERSSTSGSQLDTGSMSNSSFPTSMGDMQEQMRNQMKDPAMRQMEESSSGGIGRGKNKRFWHAEEDKALVSSLVELSSDSHWKCENGFRNGYMVRLEEMMNTRLPGCGMKATPHIDSRLKTLTTKYRAISAMLRTSGFKWDDSKKMVSVGRDVYDLYCKTHPTARNLYGVSFPHFHELNEIFGKDYATGKRTEDYIEAVENMEKEDNGSSSDHGDEVESAPPKKFRKRKGSEGASGASNVFDLSILQNCMQDMSSHLSTMAGAWTRSQNGLMRQQEREEELAMKRDNVMDELLKLDKVTLDQVLEAATILTAEPNKLNVFLSMSSFPQEALCLAHSRPKF